MEMRNAIISRLDAMTGQWAELRDMGRDDWVARSITDAAVFQPERREDVLLEAVIMLLRENAEFRKHTLRVLETTHTPLFMPRDGDGGRDG